MFELMDGFSETAVIKVIGVGGGGGNAVGHMVRAGIEGVEFICANTDAQALKSAKVKTNLQIGCNITKGLGAGANPDVGRQAAMEDRERIAEVLLTVTARNIPMHEAGKADLDKLISYGLSFQQLADAIRQFSIDLPAGAIDSESGTFIGNPQSRA